MVLIYEVERVLKQTALPSIHLLGEIVGNLEESFVRVEVKTWFLPNI
jgi:hypothetical protein